MLQGFQYYVEAEDADILILTETRVCCRNHDAAKMLLTEIYKGER